MDILLIQAYDAAVRDDPRVGRVFKDRDDAFETYSRYISVDNFKPVFYKDGSPGPRDMREAFQNPEWFYKWLLVEAARTG